MKRAELETALREKFAEVLKISGPTTAGKMNYYVANVLDVNGDTARQVNVGYFVLHERKPNETAYWPGAEPKPTPAPSTPTFTDDVVLWLQSKVADEAILHFSGLAANNITKRATVNVVKIVAGDWVEKRFAVWQNSVDAWQFQEIK